jgi:hypothetical protein
MRGATRAADTSDARWQKPHLLRTLAPLGCPTAPKARTLPQLAPAATTESHPRPVAPEPTPREMPA